MTKRKLKSFVLPTIYTLSIAVFVISMYFVQQIFSDSIFQSDSEQEYVDDEIITSDDTTPVVSESVTIVKPYLNENVKVSKSFYDYQGESSNQEASIIYYEDTYMQNSGVDYTSEETFDVIAVLDGKVTKVEDNELLGKTIEITHDNDIISVYQSVGEPSVKVDDVIVQGQVIAQSGTSNVNKELTNSLHFELYHKGMIVNPEEYYNKAVNDL